MKKVIKAIGLILLCVIAIPVIYVSYVFISYDRIDDYLPLAPNNDNVSKKTIALDREYTIVSQNIGFGAYLADFTFFMDGGKESRARSKESVLDVFDMAKNVIVPYNPDFTLIQELDVDATRSYHIDQREIIDDWFEEYASLFGYNYDSAYLMYPLNKPHGASKSGLYTISKVKISDGLRRQLPISKGFSKVVDLDRAYTISRIDVDNGKELVIYNTHMSAYAVGENIKESQLTQLVTDMQHEYELGNYCICGGDFNADFTGDSVQILNNGLTTDMGWAQPLQDDLLGDNLKKCVEYTNGQIIPSCRNCDKPYEEGDFTIIVDGFLITDNIEMTYLENVQTNFEYSDHNPVVMRFKLK